MWSIRAGDFIEQDSFDEFPELRWVWSLKVDDVGGNESKFPTSNDAEVFGVWVWSGLWSGLWSQQDNSTDAREDGRGWGRSLASDSEGGSTCGGRGDGNMIM